MTYVIARREVGCTVFWSATYVCKKQPAGRYGVYWDHETSCDPRDAIIFDAYDYAVSWRFKLNSHRRDEDPEWEIIEIDEEELAA